MSKKKLVYSTLVLNDRKKSYEKNWKKSRSNLPGIKEYYPSMIIFVAEIYQ
jgi:hypothetical protein